MSFPEIPAGAVPRVHGNGFIQVDLNDGGTKRLHVWHRDIPRQVTATPIHDHVFNMRSTVLLGTLIHDELRVRELVTNPENGTHRIYRAVQEEGTQNTTLVPDEGTVVLDVVQHLVLGAGSLYTFPAFKLHTSDHRGLTATVMEKLPAPRARAESGYGRPRVLVPVGAEPDNDFKRDGFNPDMLWPFIAAVRELCS